MKAKKKKRHYLKRYKERIRSTIQKEVLLISSRIIDTLCSAKIPEQMFQSSILPNDSIINNCELDSLKFSLGYASVAINLLSICQYSRDNLVKDSYIFPALYCFRIYMENSMKESILLLKPGIDIEDLKTHNLISLWRKLTPHITQDDTTNMIQRYIVEFDNYDPDSTAFRYSHLVNGKLGECKGEILKTSISIDALRSSMLLIYHSLEGINELARQSKDIND